MQSRFRIFRILGAKMCLSRLYGAIWGIIRDDFVGISGIEALVLGETNAGFSNCFLTGAALEGSTNLKGDWGFTDLQIWRLVGGHQPSNLKVGGRGFCQNGVQDVITKYSFSSLNKIFDVIALLATALWQQPSATAFWRQRFGNSTLVTAFSDSVLVRAFGRSVLATGAHWWNQTMSPAGAAKD